ncbi:MAG: caspase family protein, partial [Methyloligellaceae bacterium]
SLGNRSRSTSVGRGLARVEKAVGMMIAFATQPGNVALDGDGRNSPFTRALLKNIETQGASIGDMMIEVRNDVISATEGKQVPWENSSLTGRFFFKPAGASPEPAQQQANHTRGQLDVPNTTFDHTFWTSIRDSNNPSLYQEYLNRFPDGVFSPIAQAKLRKMRSIKVEEKPAAAPAPKKEEVKQALLQDQSGASAPAVQPAAPAIDPEEVKRQLARDMQTALKRHRCYLGRVDGLWGPGSRAAVTRFNQVSRKRLSGEPNADSIGVIKAWKGRKCAVVTRKRPRTRSTTTQTKRRRPPESQERTARSNERRRPPSQGQRKPPPQRNPPPQREAPANSGGGIGSIFIGRGGGGLTIGGGIRF